MKNTIYNRKIKYNGFTLVELLVVISIIAILSVIGVTVFSNVQKGSRDTKRKADIEAISKAYETAYNATTATYTVPTGTTAYAAGTPPTDPGSFSYTGNTVNSAKGFWACAQLEVASGNASAIGNTATTCALPTNCYPTYVTTNAGTHYCKSSQQGQ